MVRLSLFPSRRMTHAADISALYERSAQGWQAGLLRIGFDQAFSKTSPYSNEIDLLDLSPAMLAIAEQNVPGRTRAIHGSL